jgi:hypothetical protein
MKLCIKILHKPNDGTTISATVKIVWPENSAPFVVPSLVNTSEVTEITLALIPSKTKAK